MTTCTHLDHIQITELLDEVQGCEDSLAAGTQWLHLRICLECGTWPVATRPSATPARTPPRWTT